jgi:hypothetical protein
MSRDARPVAFRAGTVSRGYTGPTGGCFGRSRRGDGWAASGDDNDDAIGAAEQPVGDRGAQPVRVAASGSADDDGVRAHGGVALFQRVGDRPLAVS